MQSEINVLKRRDLASLSAVENVFHTGLLAGILPQVPDIERRQKLSRQEFEKNYRKTKRPVLLEGLAEDWPAVKKWSFEHLVESCGLAQVTVNSYNSKKAREVTFAEFVQTLKKNEKLPSSSPVYLQEWYYQTACPWLSEDIPDLDIAQYDFRRNLYGEAISTNHQLWIGQQGGITRIHQDSYMVDVMHVQIVGEKRWYVMGPNAELHYNEHGHLDLQTLCDNPETQLMQCVLKPGDVLYLPALWFHRIELLSNSIGLGRKCLDESNLQMHIRLRMAELLALLLNQDEIKQSHPELFDVVMMRNRSWAKRMNIDLSKLRP